MIAVETAKDDRMDTGENFLSSASPKGTVLGLISDMVMASRIAKASKQCHLGVHNVDKADAVLSCLDKEKAVLLLIDWDGCEAEAFRLLRSLRGDSRLKAMPVMGFVSKSKEILKEEAQRAGCDRVFFKSEFLNELDMILARCAL